MKDEKLNEVLQNMLPYLDNAQMDQLKKVLQAAFWNCSITEKSGNGVLEETNEKVIALFLASKRVEGCSEKTLSYYKSTIEIATTMMEGADTSPINSTLIDERAKMPKTPNTIKSIPMTTGWRTAKWESFIVLAPSSIPPQRPEPPGLPAPVPVLPPQKVWFGIRQAPQSTGCP